MIARAAFWCFVGAMTIGGVVNVIVAKPKEENRDAFVLKDGPVEVGQWQPPASVR